MGLALDLAHGSNPPASLSRLFDGEGCLSLPNLTQLRTMGSGRTRRKGGATAGFAGH